MSFKDSPSLTITMVLKFNSQNSKLLFFLSFQQKGDQPGYKSIRSVLYKDINNYKSYIITYIIPTITLF
jgi:hypothetical protein